MERPRNDNNSVRARKYILFEFRYIFTDLMFHHLYQLCEPTIFRVASVPFITSIIAKGIDVIFLCWANISIFLIKLYQEVVFAYQLVNCDKRESIFTTHYRIYRKRIERCIQYGLSWIYLDHENQWIFNYGFE